MIANEYLCPACWGAATARMDKHGNPYLKCVSGCRFFARGPDSLAALEVVSGWISQTLKRMETDPQFREDMQGIVTRCRRNLRSMLNAPKADPAPSAEKKEQAA